MLMRSAFSPNIKERRDYSCALFDGDGRAVAVGDHMPVHLGSMPSSVEQVLKIRPPGPGEMVAVNDPFAGGTHLPDITLVAPYPLRSSRPRYYLANRAHHSDVGGMSPGSMPPGAREIFQEGVILPPVRLFRDREPDPDLLALFLANVRTPREREADLRAQAAANQAGARRLGELEAHNGIRSLAAWAGEQNRLRLPRRPVVPEGNPRRVLPRGGIPGGRRRRREAHPTPGGGAGPGRAGAGGFPGNGPGSGGKRQRRGVDHPLGGLLRLPEPGPGGDSVQCRLLLGTGSPDPPRNGPLGAAARGGGRGKRGDLPAGGGPGPEGPREGPSRTDPCPEQRHHDQRDAGGPRSRPRGVPSPITRRWAAAWGLRPPLRAFPACTPT